MDSFCPQLGPYEPQIDQFQQLNTHFSPELAHVSLNWPICDQINPLEPLFIPFDPNLAHLNPNLAQFRRSKAIQ